MAEMITFQNLGDIMSDEARNEYNSVRNEARQALSSGNVEKALILWSTYIDQFPSHMLGYYQRGGIFEQTGNDRTAINDYTKAIVLEPDAGHIYATRGELYYKMGEHRNALNDFNLSVELLGPRSRTLYFRGKIHDALGDFDSAVQDFAHAFRLYVSNTIGGEIQEYIKKHKGENYKY